MRKYVSSQLYVILILSVFFQSYLNLYDTYIENRVRNAYYNHQYPLEQSNFNSSDNVFIRTDKHKENFYIPKQAQYVRHFLRTSPIDSFRLSPLIVGPFIRHAILEGAYPIQVSEGSHYLITASNDISARECKVLDSKEGIQIVYCP